MTARRYAAASRPRRRVFRGDHNGRLDVAADLQQSVAELRDAPLQQELQAEA
jgi:hypothetical protein